MNTGEEILPSNQQQIIEQAKFTYSPLGIKAIQGNKEQSVNNYNYIKDLLLAKEREIFRDIYNDRLEQIQRANFDDDYNNLKYTVVSTGKQFDFSESEDPLVFLNDIKKGKISIQEAKNIQKEYDKYLKLNNKGKPLII